MPGQPQIPPILTFNVMNLAIQEPPGSQNPAVVVDTGQPFSLSVDFDGSGFIWGWLEAALVGYQVNFFAEGIGVAAPDFDFGVVPGALAPAGGPYTATLNVPGIAQAGIYEVAALVKFPGLSGLHGFESGLTISVGP